jgi:hypothetical protein
MMPETERRPPIDPPIDPPVDPPPQCPADQADMVEGEADIGRTDMGQPAEVSNVVPAMVCPNDGNYVPIPGGQHRSGYEKGPTVEEFDERLVSPGGREIPQAALSAEPQVAYGQALSTEPPQLEEQPAAAVEEHEDEPSHDPRTRTPPRRRR